MATTADSTKDAGKILRFPGEHDPTLPDVSIAQYVLDIIKGYGNDEACFDSETKEAFTYVEVAEKMKSLAAGLQIKFNLALGERIAIALPLCMEYSIASLAVQLCGATAVLINPAQTISELKHCAKICEPITMWFSDEPFTSKFDQLYPAGSNRPRLIVPRGDVWNELMAIGKGKAIKPVPIRPKEDVAFVFFSSGTTGVPKGVMLTHTNLVAARRINAEMIKGFPRDPNMVGAIFLPPYHTAGYTAVIDGLCMGVRYVIIRNFTLHKLLQAVQDYKISTVVIVPPLAVELAKKPYEEMYDLSSLIAFRSGSGAVSKEIIQMLNEKFNSVYYQVYGMTETTMATHLNFIDYNKDGSIGVVRPFCESKIVDLKTGEALGPNQEGEICVRGALVMKGYIGNEEATKATIDADGWLHSGDIGYYDEEGFFFVTDRLKELIKYNGFQVSPTELEHILMTHPDVVDAAVAPVPDERSGELPRAFVVRRQGSTVTEEELKKLIEDRVSAHKRLRGGVVFVNSIPKNPTGKIMRRELKKMISKL